MAGTFTQAALLVMRNKMLGGANIWYRMRLHSGDPGIFGTDNLVPMFRHISTLTDPALTTDVEVVDFGPGRVITSTSSPFGPIEIAFYYSTSINEKAVLVEGPIIVSHVSLWYPPGQPIVGFVAAFNLDPVIVVSEKMASIGAKLVTQVKFKVNF